MKLNRARHLLAITIIVVYIAYLLSACDSKLRGAYLRGANLIRADLRGTNLSKANLYRANLRDTNLP